MQQQPLIYLVIIGHGAVLTVGKNCSIQYSTNQYWYLPLYPPNTTAHMLSVKGDRNGKNL